MTKLPRLYINGKFSRIIYPVGCSITQNMVPLSTASMTLRSGDTLPARSWLELFTPYGSAGMFRVRSPRDAYGQETTTAELEHMISEVGDYLVKEEISKMMTADKALKQIFSHYGGKRWKLGSVTALKKKQVAVDVKYGRVLDAMLEILDQIPNYRMSFNFSTTPWTVNFVEKGTTVAAEGRLARNVTSATVTYDDTELITRLWYKKYTREKKTNEAKMEWVSVDADTLKTYGIIEGTVSTDVNMTDAERDATVNTYLAEHKKPRISISIQAAELAQITGESMDKFTIGKLMRLALPDYDTTVEENITSVYWQDVYNSPGTVTVNLGAEEDTVVTFLHNLDSKGSGGGGGGKNKKEDDEDKAGYSSEWDKQDNYIAGMVQFKNEAGSIIRQAGLTLDDKGLLVYSKDVETGIYSNFVLGSTFESEITDEKTGIKSKINQTADTIGFLVEGTGKDSMIKPASIQASINKASGKSKIRLSADHIILDGNVVANAIQTSEIKVSSLEVTNGVDCKDIECNNIDATGISINSGDVNAPDGTGFFDAVKVYCGNEDPSVTIDSSGITVGSGGTSLYVYDGSTKRKASWQSCTIDDPTFGAYRYYLYGASSSSTTALGATGMYPITARSTKTIYYLGRT